MSVGEQSEGSNTLRPRAPLVDFGGELLHTLVQSPFAAPRSDGCERTHDATRALNPLPPERESPDEDHPRWAASTQRSGNPTVPSAKDRRPARYRAEMRGSVEALPWGVREETCAANLRQHSQ